MKNLIHLTDYTNYDISKIHEIASKLEVGDYSNVLRGKTIILFFSNFSIRTRVTFEKGIAMLGGQSILFPSETLDKKEEIKDVVGYLNNWADCLVVRHSNIDLLSDMTRYSTVPIINAMTSVNHPCEILSDLYAISKLKKDYLKLNYTFVGAAGNIGDTWAEASKLLGFRFIQSCPKGYEMDNILIEYDIKKAMENCDVVLTDSIPDDAKNVFSSYQITKELLKYTNRNSLLNPCPPFSRGNEVSTDAIDSENFVGYDFKKSLLCVQQAIILYSVLDDLTL